MDIAAIYIGDGVMLGPQVGLYTASHPIDAEVRSTGIEYGKIYIGDNVWIGALAIVNPGVTIGCNTIIGSGSVVTRDIPEGVIAAGNPCKVIRAITDEDKEHWQRLHKQYLDETVQ